MSPGAGSASRCLWARGSGGCRARRKAAVIETLKEFVGGADPTRQGSDDLWASSLASDVVVEAPDAAGRCVRTPEPTPRNPKLPFDEHDNPLSRAPTGIGWLSQRRATFELPYTLEGRHVGNVFPPNDTTLLPPWRGLRPADVSFRGSRLASWRGISVLQTGVRDRVRIWLARDGSMGSRWQVIYLDFCPDTFAGP